MTACRDDFYFSLLPATHESQGGKVVLVFLFFIFVILHSEVFGHTHVLYGIETGMGTSPENSR